MNNGSSRALSALNAIYPPIVFIILLLVFWQIGVTQAGIPVWMLAKPSDIAARFVANTQAILPYITTTYATIVIGFVISIVIGVAIAILNVAFPRFGSAITPLMVAMCCIPMITLVPTLMLTFGLGQNVKLIVIVVQSFPIVTMNATTALLNVDPAKIELMKALKASKSQLFRYCMLRDALPGIFTGIKLASIRSMIGGITSEMTGGNTGLGSRISFFMGFSKTPEALSCVIYIVVLGACLYGAASLVEHLLNPSER